MSLLRVCLGGASLLLAAIAACSSTTSDSDCSTNPFQCASGTTCTVSGTSGTCNCTTPSCFSSPNCTPQFQCLKSANAKTGETCTTTLGKASCADGLTCIVTEGQGTCLPYCDTANPCAGGSMCQATTINLGPSPPVIHVCEEEMDSSFPFETGCQPPPFDAGEDVSKSDASDAMTGDGPMLLPDGGLPK
jgi:hypothetical protein